MDYGLDFIEREMAGLAVRLEAMERENDARKRTEARTPGGLFVPKSVTLPAVSTSHLDTAIAAMNTRLDEVVALLHKVAKVQTYHQRTIEELALMSNLVE